MGFFRVGVSLNLDKCLNRQADFDGIYLANRARDVAVFFKALSSATDLRC